MPGQLALILLDAASSHLGTAANLAEIIGVILAVGGTAAAALSIGNSRRKDQTIATWKELYEAKDAEHQEHQKECLQRVATLEGRMDTMTEEFAHQIAMAVVGAMKIVMEDHQENVPHPPARRRPPSDT